jgi:hypothetical protein
MTWNEGQTVSWHTKGLTLLWKEGGRREDGRVEAQPVWSSATQALSTAQGMVSHKQALQRQSPEATADLLLLIDENVVYWLECSSVVRVLA